jgi:hypothetical protein
MFALTASGCAASSSRTGMAGDHRPRDPQIARMLNEIDAKRIESDVRSLAAFHTRHTLSDEPAQTSGIVAAREWIRRQLDDASRASGGRLHVAMHETMIERMSERVPRPVKVVNVLATLPGTTDPNRVYVVSGHYDSRASEANDYASRAPGANDDASGTALVIELARVMSRSQFDATIVFVAVAGEEQGLLGAAALAEKAKNERWNLEAMFTNDIVGNTHGGNGVHDDARVRVFSEGVPTVESPMQLQARQSTGGENDGPSRQVARYIDEVAQQYTPNFDVTLIWRRDRFGRGGDHIPFNRQGFAAVRFTEPNENYDRQHQDVRVEDGKQYGDTPEHVDFNYIANVARVNCAALATMARAPARVGNVTISAQLEYDTTLSWEPSTEADLGGYVVLARETTAPTWQHRIDVEKSESRARVRLSKDDYIFAVQAVDRDGHTSIPAPPLPARRRDAATTPTTRD